jgi:hypothetical protein
VGGEEARVPRDFLCLKGKRFSSGIWHASLGEGLAWTSRYLENLKRFSIVQQGSYNTVFWRSYNNFLGVCIYSHAQKSILSLGMDL